MADQCVNACHDSAVENKLPMVDAVRDYPKGCGRFVGSVLKCSVQSKISALMPREIKPPLDSIGKEEGTKPLKISHTPLEAEDSLVSRGNGEWEFPRSCGKTLVSSKENSLKASAAAKMIHLDHKNFNVEHASTEDSSENQKKFFKCNKGLKCSEDQKGKKQVDNKNSNGKLLSKFDSRTLSQGNTRTSLDPRALRMIVHGLMAEPNSSWRQGKRAFQSKLSSGTVSKKALGI